MDKLIIVPHTERYAGVYSRRIANTYLHGQIEYMCGYDIFGIGNPPDAWLAENSYLDISKIPSGIYECTFEGYPCTLYLWVNNIPHGLVVFDFDRESVEYAKESYLNKVSSI